MSSFFENLNERELTRKTSTCVCESSRDQEELDRTVHRLARSYAQMSSGNTVGAQLEIEYRISDASLDAADFREETQKHLKTIETLTGLSICSTKTEVKYARPIGAIFTLIWFEPCAGIRTGI